MAAALDWRDFERVAGEITAAIDAYAVATWSEPFRTHMGASVLGNPCERAVWSKFRWLARDKYTDKDGTDQHGRMLRLFQRGHLEELRWIDYLRGIGFEAYEVDPDTGKQWRISAHEGHFGGSADAILIAPERWSLGGKRRWLGEFKTYNSNQFDKLLDKGLNYAKPEHVVQTNCYGFGLELDFSLYCAVCKDDDRILLLVRKIDRSAGQAAFDRAGRLIQLRAAPPKISLDPSFWRCRFCEFQGLCHNNEQPEINCRSCKFSEPGPAKSWICNLHKETIPHEFIPQGCPNHLPHK